MKFQARFPSNYLAFLLAEVFDTCHKPGVKTHLATHSASCATASLMVGADESSLLATANCSTFGNFSRQLRFSSRHINLITYDRHSRHIFSRVSALQAAAHLAIVVAAIKPKQFE